MEAEPLVVPLFVLSGQADATGAGLRHGQGGGLQGTEHHWALACSALGFSGETRLEKSRLWSPQELHRLGCVVVGFCPGIGVPALSEAVTATGFKAQQKTGDAQG